MPKVPPPHPVSGPSSAAAVVGGAGTGPSLPLGSRDLKKVLAANVKALMVRRYGRSNTWRLANDAGLGPASVHRVLQGETSVGLDVMEKIARFFRVDGWQLLHPALDIQTAAAVVNDEPAAIPSDQRAVQPLPSQMGEFLPPVAPAAYVMLALAERLTGYTVKAMERKIDQGDWIEGREWVKAPDGSRLISLKGYVAWVEGER